MLGAGSRAGLAGQLGFRATTQIVPTRELPNPSSKSSMGAGTREYIRLRGSECAQSSLALEYGKSAAGKKAN